MKEPNTDKADAAAEPARRQGVRRIDMTDDRIESRDLFVGTREIVIVHGDDSYRLRLTAQNKLILTK